MPKIVEEYMGDGNTPPVKDGKFPVLQLDNGARYVGRASQSLKELRAEAIQRGFADG